MNNQGDKKQQLKLKYGKVGVEIYCALREQRFTEFPMYLTIDVIKWLLHTGGFEVPRNSTIYRWRDQCRREWKRKSENVDW